MSFCVCGGLRVRRTCDLDLELFKKDYGIVKGLHTCEQEIGERKEEKKERKKRAYMLKTLNFLLINSTSYKYIEHNMYTLSCTSSIRTPTSTSSKLTYLN